MDFLAKPTILAAIQSPKFPFVYNIAARHLRMKDRHAPVPAVQQQHAPHRLVDQLDDRVAAQHTPVVA
jgi:hypothetical protein